MELLVVLGLISAFAVVIVTSLPSRTGTVALESGQALLANIVTAARARAVASNRPVRMLVRNVATADDYRRLLVLVQLKTTSAAKNSPDSWEIIDSFTLPAGVFLLPQTSQMLPGLRRVPEEWTGASAPLRSSALESSLFVFPYDGPSEGWEYWGVTANGTNETNPGDLIVALGQSRGANVPAGTSPIELQSPDAIRGLSLSSYGVLRLIDDRSGF